MNNRQKENIATVQNGSINVLRICTLLLAAVSFWATAQGMSEYVFSQKWQAFAASLAIQGLLVGLNFCFPTFWRYIGENAKDSRKDNYDNGSSDIFGYIKEHAGSFMVKFGLLVLTGIVLFCSSWFSFIFIVGKVYQKSWDVESRLLIQSTYRQILYEAYNYTENCEDGLRNTLEGQILSLYKRAQMLESKDVALIQDYIWEQEEADYTEDDFEASDEMKIAIGAMKNAAEEEATNSDLEYASALLQDVKVRMESELVRINERITIAEEDVENARANADAAQRRLNRASGAVDISDLKAAVETAESIYLSREEELESLQKQRVDYETALSRVGLYEISINSVIGSFSGLIGDSLRSIQQELYKDNIDMEIMEYNALVVFEQFQSATRVSVEDGTDYPTMLKETYKFINDLRDYCFIRGIAVSLEDLIEKLQMDAEALINSEGSWKEEWSARLNGLKSLIGALPIYIKMEDGRAVSYDKAEAADKLDNMLRLYIAEHNAAQQGIIYLSSPYRGLAVFSIILAFFLDIAAFVTGLLIDVADRRREIILKKNPTRFGAGKFETYGKTSIDSEMNMDRAEYQYMLEDEEYSPYYPPTCLNRYLYLNGDYVRENEKNTYRAIENGEEIEINILDTGLTQGLYIENENEVTLIPAEQQLIFLATESGPRDGVYQNCSLSYEDNVLLIKEKANPSNKYHYLAAIEEEVPVYQLSNGTCTVMEAHFLNGNEGKTVVISLNKKGSRIAAVYILKDINPFMSEQKEFI